MYIVLIFILCRHFTHPLLAPHTELVKSINDTRDARLNIKGNEIVVERNMGR